MRRKRSPTRCSGLPVAGALGCITRTGPTNLVLRHDTTLIEGGRYDLHHRRQIETPPASEACVSACNLRASRARDVCRIGQRGKLDGPEYRREKSWTPR